MREIWPSAPKNDMAEVFQLIGLLILAALKFFMSPAASIIAGYSLLETILISSLGGISGFLFFYYFGGFLYQKYLKLFANKRKNVFSKRSRRIVKFKHKYGFLGLAILTPVLFGIPLGSFIAAAFFKNRLKTISVFVSSIVIWSILISIQCAYFKTLW